MIDFWCRLFRSISVSLLKQLIVLFAFFSVGPVGGLICSILSRRFADYKEVIWVIGFFVMGVLALSLFYYLRAKTDFGKQIRGK